MPEHRSQQASCQLLQFCDGSWLSRKKSLNPPGQLVVYSYGALTGALIFMYMASIAAPT